MAEAAAVIRQAADEEQEYYDNMPENMQSSDRGTTAETVAGKLSEWADALEEMQPDALSD